MVTNRLPRPESFEDATGAFSRGNPPAMRLSHTMSLEFSCCEGVMVHEEFRGALWANVVAILAVTGAIGILYLPLLLG